MWVYPAGYYHFAFRPFELAGSLVRSCEQVPKIILKNIKIGDKKGGRGEGLPNYSSYCGAP